ncbi:sensor histidine kinase [Thalassococcus profundi]|uniref:histidine kinase n=1 Tax=Thalassococcus profundi TaxID=2282382 RepID=A0A369TTV8_9RHOB|nr:ATP-binding protein [Thalassococcus profundi]RDD67587.1 sensor histidine kinase [Thalassococcus profundi]
MTPRHPKTAWPLLLLCAILAAGVAGFAAWHVAKASLGQRLDRSLVLTARTIEAEIERFRYLPSLALEDPRIRAAISAPEDATATLAASRALAVAAEQSGADELFLLNADGTTLASSNWQDAGSFVGENYAFRPYFRDAMRVGAGRFYAVGVTTGKPGYFLSSRGRIADRTAVMVVKVDLRPLQETWRDAGGTLAVADRYGVVILSGAPDWIYRPLTPLDPAREAAIAEARAFAEIPVTERAPVLEAADQQLAALDSSLRLLRQQRLPVEDWTLLGSTPAAPALRAAWMTGAVALLTTLMLGLLAQTYRQRRRLIDLRLRQGALLETRVTERTAALAREIEERRRTEDDLREAQDALVHSEKMAALGRMSAAIVHEISQPLAAMEATLAAALLSGKIEDAYATSRIEKARGHIRRILRTIRHLKSFSRKESGDRRPVPVDAAIHGALELVAPRATDGGVSIGFDPDGPSPVILAGQVRLEQVLVNLLMNALDAVAGRADARIAVERSRSGSMVEIAVVDNGLGIPSSLLARVAEPFFSTKQTGESLGLGLSISRAIVEEFGGRMQLADAPGGGTRATLSFELLTEDRVAAE